MDLNTLRKKYDIKELANGKIAILKKGWSFPTEKKALDFLSWNEKDAKGVFAGLQRDKGKWVGTLPSGKKTRRKSFYDAFTAVYPKS